MFYKIAVFALKIYTALLFRVKVEGRENIPADGGFILCSNHGAGHDPIFLAVTVKRSLYFMAKKELFQNWISKRFFKGLHGFPVDRGATDMTSFKTTLKLLSEGKALLIFAQGHRMKELDVKSAKSGAAMFAIKGGVPVLPVGITSTYKFFSRVHIKYGKPIDLSEYSNAKLKSETLDKITEKIMTEIKSLTLAEGEVI